MFYKELAGMANKIIQTQPDLDGLLQMFCLRKVADHKFLAAFFLQVERDGRLHLVTFYGALPEEIGLSETSISIFDNHPASEAARTGSIAWSKHQISKNRAGSLVAWPVFSEERILGVLLALYEVPFSKTEHDLEYFEAISTVIGGAIIKNVPQVASSNTHRRSNGATLRLTPESDSETVLSERQELILKLISEGRTNGDIADVLGYSESLIRQETIRIYAILRCSGRAEATAIYKAREGSKQVLAKSAK